MISPRALLSSFVMLATLVAVPAAPVAAANSGWADTQDRQEVIDRYRAEFAQPIPDPGWTGDRGSCRAGTTSQAYRDAIFSRINWFRGMAGVPVGITENATYSSKAQEAALMMSVSGRLSHNPDTSFGCYTANGDEAAGSSNLYLGRSGPEAITGYMRDPGANNRRVGHRNWILHPTAEQMGTGDIPSSGGWESNALWVFDNIFDSQPALRESAGFVAWPPRGYVPGEVVFPRWSFSIRGANFTSAAVSMARVFPGGDTVPVNTTVEHRDSTGGAPFSIIVWNADGIETNPAQDVTYRVTVSGVGGTSSSSYSYDVIVLGAAPAPNSSVDYSDYVASAYADFLGRNPTPTELAEWNARLNTGTSTYAFVLTLAESDEWSTYVIDRMYLDTLGRSSDPGGLAYWTARLQAGMPVAEVAALFYGSPEYLANEGNSYEAWVTDLYAELLYRAPDPGGLAYWVDQTRIRGTFSVAQDFYQSEESRRTRVDDLFESILGRSPDPAGHAYWTEVLLDGDDVSLAANLAASAEYVAAAGRR